MLDQRKIKEANMQALWSSDKTMTYTEMDAIFHKHLTIVDFGLTKVVPAIFLAGYIPGNPAWAFLVGGSGCGKSVMLEALDGIPLAYPLSSITPQTLLSGAKGYKGLLYEIDGKTLVFKDWTTILSMAPEAKNAILGQFREVFDGSVVKKFGTGENGEPWRGKVNVISGVTSIIDFGDSSQSALGERFVKYKIAEPGRKIIARQALKNSNNLAQIKDELRDAMTLCVKTAHARIGELNGLILTTEEEDNLIDLADLATLARSPIIRDFGTGKEILFKPSSEMPTRFTQQLAQIAMGLKLLNIVEGKGDKIEVLDMKILSKIALDSIQNMRRAVLQELAIRGSASSAEIATALNLPTPVTSRNLQDLNLLTIIDRHKTGREDTWTMRPDHQELLAKYDDLVIRLEPQDVVIDEEMAQRRADEEAEPTGLDI